MTTRRKVLLWLAIKCLPLLKSWLRLKHFINAIAGREVANTERISRDIEKEVSRVTNTPGFSLFLKGDTSSIVDTDFYEYLGVTVRTSHGDFIGRLNTLSDVVKNTASNKNEIFKKLFEYHTLMTTKFSDIIRYKEEH